MFLIRAGAIENLGAHVKHYGLNPNTMLAHFGFDSLMLREPESLISYVRTADLLDHCARETGDPLFSLKLTRIQSPLAIGELMASSSQQRSLREAMIFTNQHIRLHANGIRLAPSQEGERLNVSFEFDFTNSSGLEQLKMLTLGHVFKAISALLGEDNPQVKILSSKRFTHHQLDSLGTLKKHLKCGQDEDCVSVPLSWLDKEISQQNEVLKTHFKQRIETLEGLYPEDLASQVRYLCSTWLSTGDCSLERVSAALNMHPRILQKRLMEKGESFRDLLLSVRQLKAEQLLRNRRMSITDIALNIGYSETAVFSRNFKKWTGKTPLKWRSEQAR